MNSNKVERRVKRSFLGEGESVPYRKGQRVMLDPSRANGYDSQGLTEAMPARPSKADGLAASAANKAAKAGETKESGAGGKPSGAASANKAK